MMITGYRVGQPAAYTADDVDNLWESAAAREWEQLNDCPDEPKYYEAAASLRKAVELLDKACDAVYLASENAEGLPLEKKLEFMADDLRDRMYDLKIMMNAALRCDEV